MSDSTRLTDVMAVARTIPREWGLVVRHYDTPERALLVREVVRQCRARGVVVLVAGDARFAKSVGADGVHIPEGLIGMPGSERSALRGCPLITASAHGARGLHKARQIGAEAVLLSPVYATASHASARPLGRMRFAAMTRLSGAKVFALGGVTLRDAHTLRRLGASGIAGIGLIKTV